jgi:hypothetical protein
VSAKRFYTTKTRAEVHWGCREVKAPCASDTFTPPGPLTTSTIASRSCASGGTATSAKAVSLGLIVTELVINALKHAFPKDRPDGQVVVSYQIDGPDWKLVVSDNGIGKPDNVSIPVKGGLGTTLVKAPRCRLRVIPSHGTPRPMTSFGI